jgi:hypothetical protein
MLGAMDVPAAAAGPWIALGAVLGILLLLAVAAGVLRWRSRPPAAPPAGPLPAETPRDDLAAFLDSPPGTPGAPDDDREGWAPLAAPPPAPAAEGSPAPAAPGPRPGTVVAALALVAVLLLGAAAALAVAARSDEPPASTAAPSDPPAPGSPAPAPEASPGPDGIAARLAFEGVVLQEHAVGITAAHPELELTVTGDRGVAHLSLPAVNCLATAAPPAAGDPACRAARGEFADLASPELRVDREGDEVTVSGRFATYRRPPGGVPEETGRSYDVSVTVTLPDDEGSGWVPTEGTLLWDGRATAMRTDGPASVVRRGS